MLKMILVDDEKIIRETIFRLIDWPSYGIEIIGLCKNGLEAFDMIVDESPDIVFTDIKMPGLSGLELVKKTMEANLDTKFILLSGYGEFEYAKEAMKYGVRHYLLKPCDEQQILDCVQTITKECIENQKYHLLEEKQYQLTREIHHHIMSALIHEGLGGKKTYQELFESYEPFLDFHFTPYQLFYVFFLEQEALAQYLKTLEQYCDAHYPQVILHGVYVKNTLLLFSKHFNIETSCFESSPQKDIFKIERAAYECLSDLLCIVMEKLKRFSTISYINHFHVMPAFNCSHITESAVNIYLEIKNGQPMKFSELEELLNGIEDLNFFKQLAGSILVKEISDFNHVSAINLTEWLLKIDSETELSHLKQTVIKRLKKILLPEQEIVTYSAITGQVLEYVSNHLDECGLTLKNIAENHLYMNVDYVNKKFVKETGQKFSDYLTGMRIEKAKEYIKSGEKIQSAAERVGCGNHPHYFSQLFKKKTGMTPTEYLILMNNTQTNQIQIGRI